MEVSSKQSSNVTAKSGPFGDLLFFGSAARAEVVYPIGFDSVAFFSLNKKSVGNFNLAILF